MSVDRRTVLQSLLSLGLGQIGWAALPSRLAWQQYHQTAIAATVSRKLALLVGVNQYQTVRNAPEYFWGNLAGCVTDVELQRDLLINRYGFQPADIVTLTDGQATRANIETAFLEHLVKQAQAGDVVIFHFSGYGQPLAIGEEPNALNKREISLLPTDALPAESTLNLRQSTLLSWANSLATDKITLVLDVSPRSLGQKFLGNLRVRAYDHLPITSSSENPILVSSQAPVFPGVILLAAHPHQAAVECQGQGWSAGLFTYALTQSLWQVSTPSRINVALCQATEAIAALVDDQQQPQGELGKNTALFIYASLPDPLIGAEAVITQILDPTTVTLKLTGMARNVLEGATLNSCFQIIPDSWTSDTFVQSPDRVLVQISERTGLQAKATILTPQVTLRPGQRLQESLRFIPKQMALTLALDGQLDRIERVDATSAISALTESGVGTMPLLIKVINQGEQAADCLFGKVAEGGYGLFSEGGTILWRTREGDKVTIKSAIAELGDKLAQARALKIYRLTENEQTSSLGLKVTLEVQQTPTNLPLLQHQTRRSSFPHTTSLAALEIRAFVDVSAPSHLQYRLENYRDQPLYFLLLGIDTNGKAIAWYEGEHRGQIEPQQTVLIPPTEGSVIWRLARIGGLSCIHVVASLQPFTETWQTLAVNLPKTSPTKTVGGQILELHNFQTVIQSLLKDLQQSPAALPTNLNFNNDAYCLDTQTWTTLIFRYRVI